jgi:hypothetical protein
MTWKLPDGTILSTSSAAQQQPAVTLATPTPEERQAGIDVLVTAMTQAGVSQEDAEKVAPVLVDGGPLPETD